MEVRLLLKKLFINFCLLLTRFSGSFLALGVLSSFVVQLFSPGARSAGEGSL